MKKVDAWMLAGFLGLLGAGCGAPANDSEPAGIGAEQRIKTTVVKLNPSGQHEPLLPNLLGLHRRRVRIPLHGELASP